MTEDRRRPVTVLGGFLGSGKTTLLRRVGASGPLSGVAVVVNELGEVGLDHELVRSVADRPVLVGGGCACCERREDLVGALRELLDADQRGLVGPLRRVVIETSGLADPAPILFTIATDPVLQHHFRVDGVLVTVDGLQGLESLDLHPECGKQVAVADRLVVTKADVAPAAVLDRLEERLRARNPFASIERRGLDDPPPPLLEPLGDGRARAGAAPVSHEPSASAFALSFAEPLDWVGFSVWLSLLLQAHGEEVLRVKGVLDVAGVGPVSINGVQHVLHRPEHLEDWPDGARGSRVVLITQGLDADLLRRSLCAFQGG
ncbi:MAG: GTP-binding protein [Candidatus Dormibacteraeota bacterium]|nr:GTP-binding protein [Candidatus Dormibacteraeota bacterium]MBO0705787.1 GTP-binding protein [Candidatus Dormibacteraeota bacterium]MBO0760286.1 GTP-binding protein [Candidatus Dormibacteraeota bacterium]